MTTSRFDIAFPTRRRRLVARCTPWGRARMRFALESFVLGPGGDASASYRAGLEAAFRRYGGRGPFPADPDGDFGAKVEYHG